MHVLLVEDERATAQMLAKGLREQAYAVDVVYDGLTAIERLGVNEYDIVVLDVMLPRRNGLDVCRHVRDLGKHVPVLMLTARDEPESRIDGLDCGADDYVTKPFHFGELLARMRALMRRRTIPASPERMTVGPLTINMRTRELFIDDRHVPLTAREFGLLSYLVQEHGRLVSREDIARHVWDDHYDPLSNVIDVYVQRLRRKIDVPGRPSFIKARRGEGYQLLCDQEVST
jgi:DNA-binding response OmpR family regulator